jgi:hypothetical protein
MEPEDEVVEVHCQGCGRTTTFSPAEPEERRVCPFCNGQVPVTECGADGKEGDDADG